MAEPAPLDRLFRPAAIAVIGASASSGGLANNFLRSLRETGYPGRVYAVHPTAASIEGWPAFPSVPALPEPVDYAYVAVGAEKVSGVLAGAAHRIRFAQVISSGFSEAGREDLEADLVAVCRAAGLRLIGPNCLGLYTAAGRVSFMAGARIEPGAIGIISQSGGLGADILRRGQGRGLRFNALVTTGNAADLAPSDFLEYMLADPGFKVLGLYLEDVKDGRRFFEILRAADARKPIVILKGGRTKAGQRASASHTGALAQDDRLWQALSRQTGAVLVDTLDRFIDALLAFQQLAGSRERATLNVVLFGNGGGTSVLASDAFSRAGFSVAPLGSASAEALAALRLPAGSSTQNPIDVPAGILRQDNGALARRIMGAIGRDGSIDAVVMHLNMPVIAAYRDPNFLPSLIEGALGERRGPKQGPHFVLVLRSDGEPDIEAEKQRYREIVLALGVPVFDELPAAAEALASLAAHERFVAAR